jgi:hypothetical protein
MPPKPTKIEDKRPKTSGRQRETLDLSWMEHIKYFCTNIVLNIRPWCGTRIAFLFLRSISRHSSAVPARREKRN